MFPIRFEPNRTTFYYIQKYEPSTKNENVFQLKLDELKLSNRGVPQQQQQQWRKKRGGIRQFLAQQESSYRKAESQMFMDYATRLSYPYNP